MHPSQRLQSITGGGSDGWEVFHRAREMAARGVEVTELTIGEHDVRTDRSILEAMHVSALAGNTGYAPVPGTESLRAAIARRVEARTGVPTAADNVVVTPGGQAALFAAHLACCDPGDTALFIDPYYATYPGTIRAASARPRPVVTRAEDGFQPQPAALDAAARGARSLLVNTPNNPTGAVYDSATLAAIAEVARRHDLWVISDEVYDSQVWEGRHVSPRQLPGMAERTLVVGSMSKSHAMTGSRVGWIVAPPQIGALIVDLATVTNYGVAGFVQDAARFALEQGPPLEEKIAAPFRRRRDLVARLLAGQETVRMVPPQGAMYVMLDIRRTGRSSFDFATRLLETHHIAVMPGESFGRAARGFVRVALTVPDERLEAALRTLLDLAAALEPAQ